MVNQFENQAYLLTNQERSKYGLRPLSWNHQLHAVARNHSINMARMQQLQHTGSHMFAENIAAGQWTPQRVLFDWMNSREHRNNILNPNLTEIGIGYYNGYWTQFFG
jgi:uncharacterized protein YkwD